MQDTEVRKAPVHIIAQSRSEVIHKKLASITNPLGVVLLAHTNFDSPFVVGSHHIQRILLADPQVSIVAVEPFTGWRNPPGQGRDPAILSPRLWIPLRAGSPVWRERILNLNSRLFRVRLAAHLKKLPPNRCVILDNPYATDLACWLQDEGFRFIVRLTDWMPGQIPSPDRETNFRMLRKALARCDAVIVTSAPLARYVKLLSGRTAKVVTNGVDSLFLQPSPDFIERDPSRVIYYGALDERVDLAALNSLALRLPGLIFDFFTPSAPDRLPDRPANVHLHGPIRYDQLPRVLSRYAFALLPFANSPANHGRFPMKLFEMIGRGVQVVAPPLRSLAELHDVPGLHLSRAFGAESLAQSLNQASENWAGLSGCDRAALVQTLRARAGRETWEHKVAEILQLCRSQN